MTLSDQVTLSIVSHGHGRLLEALVDQLEANTALTGVRLIVTLNCPGETFSFERAPTHRLQLLIIRNRAKLGFGANHNQAFKHCVTPWFAVLNPDLSLPTDVFTPMIDIAIERGAALTAPQVINSEGAEEDSIRWNLTPWSLIKRRMGCPGESNLTDGRFRWFAGMFYLVDSRAYRTIGGFNTKYFLYCEDYDLCARMHLAGQLVQFVPEISVVHDARRASWKSRRYLALHLRSMWRVWFSWPVWRISIQNLVRGNRSTTVG